MNATESLASHVHRYNYDDLPQDAVDAAKTFIFDAVAVGISGSRHPRMQQLHEVARKLGAGDDATVWGSGEKLPLASAVMLNAYQVRCSGSHTTTMRPRSAMRNGWAALAART